MMAAPVITSHGETLDALRRRAHVWGGWTPLAVIEAEMEMDKSAEEDQSSERKESQ